MLNMVHANSFYNQMPNANQNYTHSWNSLNVPYEMSSMIPESEIKQENYYSYSESSDSASYESNPSPSALHQHFSNPNMHANFYMDDDQDHEQCSDSTMDSADDSFKMDMAACNKQPVAQNRGGRKQVKVGTTKRNARERNRVRYINNCFEVLREHIPFELVDEQKNRKLSKVDTLKYATIYIKQLTDFLREISDEELLSAQNEPVESNINMENASSKCQYNQTYPANEPTFENKLVNSSQMSTIRFNNINISICDNKTPVSTSLACEQQYLYSPTLSSSSSSPSSSCSSNTNIFYTMGNSKTHAPVYFNCAKTSSLVNQSSFLPVNAYHAINSNMDLKWP